MSYKDHNILQSRYEILNAFGKIEELFEIMSTSFVEI